MKTISYSLHFKIKTKKFKYRYKEKCQENIGRLKRNVS